MSSDKEERKNSKKAINLQALSLEKHFIICIPEFGLEIEEKRAIIRIALYGGKAASKEFRNPLRSCMSHLNSKSCLAGPNNWVRWK